MVSDTHSIPFPLPSEESVGIIPLFRYVQIESVQPPLLCAAHGTAEVAEERCRRSDPQVRHKAGEESGGTSEGPLEVHLFLGVELPGYQLAEDDIGILRPGKHTVTDNVRPTGDEGKLTRVTIMDIGG